MAGQSTSEQRCGLGPFLTGLRVGRAVPIPGAHLVPILSERRDDTRPWVVPVALLLEESLAEGSTRVFEVCDGGAVNLVEVDHRGDLPLLVLDGEQIHGANQDRIFNASFVIAPHTRVALPVSCIERGRWQRRSKRFSAGRSTIYEGARSRKLRRICASLAEGGGYEASQQDVWRDVRTYIDSSRVSSPTEAYEEAAASKRGATQRLLKHLRPVAGQVGLALVRRDRLRLLDVFGSPSLYARAADKVIRGLLAALYRARREPRVTPELVVARALHHLGRVEATEVPSPGLGSTYHGTCDRFAFTAAAYEGRTYHYVATGVTA